MDKSAWVQGNWNAYVVAGKTFDERKRRLAEVPEHWRAAVKRHAQTIRAIAKFHKRKEREHDRQHKRRHAPGEKDRAPWHYGD